MALHYWNFYGVNLAVYGITLLELLQGYLAVCGITYLQWYGYVSRSSGLAKTILPGTLKGGRRHGRQRKRWEDNIREWTALEFVKIPEGSGEQGKWRKLVEKSFVGPQQPSRLRDR